MAANDQQNNQLIEPTEVLDDVTRPVVEEYLRQNGIAGFSNFINDQLHAWNAHPLRIAIIGEMAVGKSTFINTMRGLPARHPNAARTRSQGVGTVKVQSYPDPNNPYLIYYDLPGMGSIGFDRETYTTTYRLDGYDFFLFLCKDRFTDNELYLGRYLHGMNKQFYFVRTHIDESIDNERIDARQAGQAFDEKAFIDQTRRQCSQDLQNIPGTHHLYLINARLEGYTQYDFPRLVQSLIQNAPGLKRDTLLYMIRANSRDIITQKAAKLKQRIFFIASLSAVIAFAPYPGLSIACDLALVTKEVRLYMQTFGIDDESLQISANTLNLSLAALRQAVFGIQTLWSSSEISFLTSIVIDRLNNYALSIAAEEFIRFMPILGQVGASAISFGTIYRVLNSILRELTHKAHNMINEIVREQEH